MTKHKYQLIIWTLVTFAAGFIMWWVWVGTVICLLMLFEFGKNAERKQLDKLDHKFFGNVKATDPDWKSFYMKVCESPAEEQFLEALINEYDLKPDYGVLRSSRLVCEMQFKHGRYRFDFLLNGRLVVEIDGFSYHSSSEAVERDRIRDAFSTDQQFTVLRIPATIVFKQPETAISRVQAALMKSNLPVKQYEPYVAPEDIKPFFRHAKESIAGSVSGLSRFLDDVGDNFQKERDADERLNSFVADNKTYIAQLEHLDKVADYIVRIANLCNEENNFSYSETDLTNTRKMIDIIDKRFSEDKFKVSFDIPDSKWLQAPTCKVDINDPLKDRLESKIKLLNSDREKIVMKIHDRCKAGKRYKAHIIHYLKAMSCPNGDGIKIAGEGYSLQQPVSTTDIALSAALLKTQNVSVALKSLLEAVENNQSIPSPIIDIKAKADEKLKPLIDGIEFEIEQLDFAVSYAEQMRAEPGIYKIKAQSEIVWKKILVPKKSDDDRVQKIVDERVATESKIRDERFDRIQKRALSDPLLDQNLMAVLIELKCPTRIAVKIVSPIYLEKYFDRYKTYDDLN